jgi:two-component system LytT family response regulator
MRKIRTLVVDDEPLARERLTTLLKDQPRFEVIGEAPDGLRAAAAIKNDSPDLVFLDVQMPGIDGFGVLDAVGGQKLPLVVFVTAYDKYALQAFDVHAVDYLLKPFDRERFEKALQRVEAQVDQQQTGDLEQRLRSLVQDLRGADRLDRLIVKSGGRVYFLKVDEIDWIEAAGNYVRLHLGGEAHLLRETMNSIEARLDGRRFLRIHRSRIVNMERIQELQPWFNGEYLVMLRNGVKLTLSRNYREKLQDRLGRAI